MSGNTNDVADAAARSSPDLKKEIFDCDSTTDSGFISSGNLLVSEEIYSDSEVSRSGKSSAVEEPEEMRVDSGVNLTESFSKLSVKTPGLNDLGKKDTTLIKLEKAKEVPWPWIKYYEQDEDGDTFLHMAIVQGFVEAALALIRAANHSRLLDTPNDDAQTPLHLAVATSQWKIARWLIVAGARPNPRNLGGDTPLHIAARNGDLMCCKAIMEPVPLNERDCLLLSYPVHSYQSWDLDQRNYDGQASVHVAAFYGQVEVLRHLAWNGADINSREHLGGYTPLHIAIERKHDRVVQFLINECKVLNPAVLTYGGRSVLQLGYPLSPALVENLRRRGVPSPYSSEDEYDSETTEEEEEMPYEPQVMFMPKLVNASA